ncbi:MAG TPA: hypothetical protein VK474_06840 [Chthoniobacterales bacterium]|nr:hypothetical protein [Chthoniobacterales bacterium]
MRSVKRAQEEQHGRFRSRCPDAPCIVPERRRRNAEILEPSPSTPPGGIGFDATCKLPGENYNREWPELVKMTEEAQRLVDALQKKS